MAHRGWSVGWKQYSWAGPIRDVIAKEMEAARLERFKLVEEQRERQDKEREQARKAALDASAEEAKAVQIARTNSIAVGALLQNLLKGMVPLAQRIQADIQAAAGTLSPKEIAKLISDTALVTRHSNEAIKAALELERLRLGQPTNIVGIQGQLDDVTTEEAVEELIGIQRTLNRAIKSGTGPGSYVDAEGNIVIDLPEEAYEEAEVIDIKRKAR